MRRFIWRSARGYHLLLHALGRAPGQGGSTQGASGLAYSRDGLDWSWVAGSDGDGGGRPVYSPNITWSDGSADGLTRRQAPYLFFDAEGRLRFLLNGVDTAPGLRWLDMDPGTRTSPPRQSLSATARPASAASVHCPGSWKLTL